MELKIPLKNIVDSLPGGQSIYENPAEYDIAIHHHPFFKEMKVRIFEFAKQNMVRNPRIMEYGAGTGNLTEMLVNLNYGYLLVTDNDQPCLNYIKNKIGDSQRRRFKLLDITKKPSNGGDFDAIVSCATDHHIPYNQKTKYLSMILSQLRPGGYFIVGEELLNEYYDEASRIKALMDYHGIIIQKSIEEGHFETAKCETMALRNGIDKFDEYKISKRQYLENIKKSGFKLVLAEKIGPKDEKDHGVYVIVAQKP